MWAIVVCACLAGMSAAGAPADDTAAPAATASPADKVTLRYRFTPGQLVHYEVTHAGEITTQVAEVAETTRNKTRSRKHFRVAGVAPDGAGELELVIDWVRLEASFGDNPPTVFQSDDPDSSHAPTTRSCRRSASRRRCCDSAPSDKCST